ncbi:fatty acid-binding protein, muscle-like [Schistocerca gregaria]|uniref:fatty acid-binding protein, muscle-like n=1 Tax=Schistocerca gregaria TaxID=7010 RepID=UPI00211F33C9|nr:fatty acid-binding protein, muscle-like [Schistocerca gregaria]
MPVDEFIGRKYKLDKSENFDEFLKALGAGMLARKMAGAVSPVVELTKDGDTYTFKSASAFRTMLIAFKLDEEFVEETPDGRKVNSTITQEGNKLHHIQKGEKTTTTVREFSDEELKMTMTVDDIVCTRIYKAI